MTMQSPTLATVKLACHSSQPTPTIDWPAVFAASAPLLTLPRAGSCFIKRRIVLQAVNENNAVTPLQRESQVVERYLASNTATALDKLVTVPWIAYARSSDGLECLVQPDLTSTAHGGLIDLHSLFATAQIGWAYGQSLKALTSAAVRALQQLHQCGIIHNDLAPDHVYCSLPPREHTGDLSVTPSFAPVKILDYDLATLVDAPSVHSNVFRGTWQFASVAAHLGLQPSFCSDYESLIYVLLSHSKLQPPWVWYEAELRKIFGSRGVNATGVNDFDESAAERTAWIHFVGDHKLYCLLSARASQSTLFTRQRDAVYALLSDSVDSASSVLDVIKHALGCHGSSSLALQQFSQKPAAASIASTTDQFAVNTLNQLRRLYSDSSARGCGNPHHLGKLQVDLTSSGEVVNSLSALYDMTNSGLMLPHFATPEPVVSDAWVMMLPLSASQAQVTDTLIKLLYTVNAALAVQFSNPLVLARTTNIKVLLVICSESISSDASVTSMQQSVQQAVHAYQQSNHTFCLPHVGVLAALDRLQWMVDTVEQRADVTSTDPL